jgi:ParB/RepB/Spo0J family partition protein
MKFEDIPLSKIIKEKFRSGDALVPSIKKEGLLQPIGVKKEGNSYKVLFGTRRVSAYIKLKKESIPACILNKQVEKEKLFLIENVCRRHITTYEMGRNFLISTQKYGYTIDEMASLLDLSTSFIKDCVMIFQHIPETAKEYVLKPIKTRCLPPERITISSAKLLIKTALNLGLEEDEIGYLIKKSAEKRFSEDMVGYLCSDLKIGKTKTLDGIEKSFESLEGFTMKRVRLLMKEKQIKEIESKEKKALNAILVDCFKKEMKRLHGINLIIKKHSIEI